MNLIEKFHHWRRRRRWNKQYRKGRWDSLKSEKEANRYFQIIDFMKKYGPKNPSILDLGCGDGVLRERMDGFDFDKFKGIDFSTVSIAKAKAKNLLKSEFDARDIIHFIPEQSYDIIVFNEVFYYIPDAEKHRVLALISNHLNQGGIIITSIFRKGIGSWPYFKENPNLKEIDFQTVTSSEENRYWKIGVYELT